MNSVADIKQKIVLEGEREYKSALKDAQRELKTLKSELKAETAELGKNATEQEKNAVKVKNLKKQIKEQEKIVKTYTDALKEVKEKYSDNQDEIAKWEVKLNDARTALANMRSGLEDVGNSFKNVSNNAEMGTVAAQSFADAFSGLGDMGETISSTVESIFSSMIDTVKAAVSELWGMITETAAKSNNWTDLAGYFGSTTTEVQKMQRSIQATQGDFGTFTNLVSQLTWGGKAEGLTEALNLSNVNYDDAIAYTEAVMNALHEMKQTDPGKANQIMSETFGRRSKDFIWFVENWETIRQNAEEMDEGGFLMSEEDVSTMNDVWLTLGKIEEKWNALKDKFASGFGVITLDIMTNVSGALDALAKFFDAETPEEREAALEELKKNIEEAFKKIAEAIRAGIQVLDEVAKDLKESEDPIVRTIGSLLESIAGILEWLTEDNMNNAVKALEILATFWIAGKGLKMVAKIGELAGHIATIKTYKGISNLLTGAGAEAGAEGATTAAAGGSGFLANIWSSITGGALGIQGAGLVLPLATLGLLGYTGKSMIDANLKDENLNAVYGDNNGEGGVVDTMSDSTAEKVAAYWRIYADESKTGTEEAFEAREDLYSALEEEGYFNAEQAVSLIENIFDNWEKENDIDGGVAGLLERLEEGGFEVPADWWKTGVSEDGVTSQDIQSLNALPSSVKQAVSELIGSIVINMDHQKVADILTPEVSKRIATAID